MAATRPMAVANSASEPYTLRLLSWACGIFLPLIIAYQGWNFWVFRRRVQGRDAREESEGFVAGERVGGDLVLAEVSDRRARDVVEARDAFVAVAGGVGVARLWRTSTSRHSST